MRSNFRGEFRIPLACLTFSQKKNRASQKDIQKGRKPFSLAKKQQKQKRKRRKLSGPADAFKVSFSSPPILFNDQPGVQTKGLAKKIYKRAFFSSLGHPCVQKAFQPPSMLSFRRLSLFHSAGRGEPACRKQKGFCLNFGEGSRKDPFERGETMQAVQGRKSAKY